MSRFNKSEMLVEGQLSFGQYVFDSDNIGTSHAVCYVDNIAFDSSPNNFGCKIRNENRRQNETRYYTNFKT